MSRFKMVLHPPSMPGQCVTCGKGECREGFVDTGSDIDGYGAIHLCYHCIRAMNDAFGFDAIARSVINESAVAQVAHYETIIRELKDDLDGSLDRLIGGVTGLAGHFDKCYRLLAPLAEKHSNRSSESVGVGELGSIDDNLGV